MTHYNIRWSGNVPLDWECFNTYADAEARAYNSQSTMTRFSLRLKIKVKECRPTFQN